MAKKPSTKVGARELKTRLGSYLARVREGETIVVTERGKPVAELRPIDQVEDRREQALRRMEAEGLITRGRGGPLAPFEPIKLPPGVYSADLIRADRDERGY